MKKSRLLGAVCAYVFPLLSMATTIGPGDFGPNATIEGYEDLGVPLDSNFSSPIVIDDNTYSFNPNHNGLQYTDDNCVSGLCMGLRFGSMSIRIDLNSPVMRAGIYTSSGTFQPETLSVLDIDGNIIEQTSTGQHVPGAGFFYGIEVAGNEISAIVFDVYNGQLVSSFDNLTTELAPIPIPPSVWLFGSGLLGLIRMARRKQWKLSALSNS